MLVAVLLQTNTLPSQPQFVGSGVEIFGRLLISVAVVYGATHLLASRMPLPRPVVDPKLPWHPSPRVMQISNLRRVTFRGCAIGGGIAFLLGASPAVFGLLVLTLPALGGWLAWQTSTEARALREEVAAAEEERTRVESDARAKEAQRRMRQEEHDRKSATVARWRRVSDALLWWSATGRRLNEDPTFLADFARSQPGVLLRYDEIHAKYTNPEDPCATSQRRAELAAWALKHHGDEIEFLAPDPADRTEEGLARILNLHLRRDVFVYREAKGLQDLEHIELVRGERWEDCYRRVRERTLSFSAGKEKAYEQIREDAKDMEPAAAAEHISRHTKLVDELIEREMRRLAGYDNRNYVKQPLS